MKRHEVPAEEVRRLLEYDPETGIFRWRIREPGTRGYYRGWNGKNAGKIAGAKNRLGYVIIAIFDVKFLAHRLAWVHVHGFWPPDQIDHINMVRDDNRIANLRLATSAQNHANRWARDRNVSGYKGAHFHKASGLWHAVITIRGRTYSLGYWREAEDAGRAYRVAANLVHGEFARTS